MRTRRSARNQERLWQALGQEGQHPTTKLSVPGMVSINNLPYEIAEHLGYQGGFRAIAVRTSTGERVAVYRGGNWRWWTPNDRLG